MVLFLHKKFFLIDLNHVRFSSRIVREQRTLSLSLKRRAQYGGTQLRDGRRCDTPTSTLVPSTNVRRAQNDKSVKMKRMTPVRVFVGCLQFSGVLVLGFGGHICVADAFMYAQPSGEEISAYLYIQLYTYQSQFLSVSDPQNL